MIKRLLTLSLSIFVLCTLIVMTGCEDKAVATTDDSGEKTAKACSSECTKSCCADKDAEAKKCSADCTKPCCAKEDGEAKKFPADCTKPCCADKDADAKKCKAGCSKAGCAKKDGEAKTCQADCTKPCCAAKAGAEQTVCPIMKKPINKELFVEHEGKKVYFCCPGCIDIFKKDPAKYVKDLPQFQQ